MRRLLLVSSSAVHGTGYLDHCEEEVHELFANRNGAAKLLFVPYALADHDSYSERAVERFTQMNLEIDSIHLAIDPAAAVRNAAGVFIGGGNTFRLLAALYENDLLLPLRERVANGMPYMGTSAGSVVACPTIKTTNDMPIVYPPSFEALGLVPFQINAHYLDSDPDSTHMGETRDVRLAEFHEENDVPVVAIREGALLRIEEGVVTLAGEPGGKILQANTDPIDCPPGSRIDRLLMLGDSLQGSVADPARGSSG